MLITTVLSALGLSAFADEENKQNEQDDGEYYTIFEWNDGMKMQRHMHLYSYFPKINAATIFFRCGDYPFYLHSSNTKSQRRSTQYFVGSTDENDNSCKDLLIGQRVAWLALIYLQCNFSTSLNCEELGFPKSPSKLSQFARKGTPDKVDPYEMTVYEIGQMDKSLLVLNQEDFLKTIGRS